jgi:two-component system, LytTR family, sensor kinase
MRQLSKPALFWILHCAGWAIFGVLMFAWGLDYLSPRDAMVNKVLLVVLGFTLTLLIRPLYRRVRAKSSGPIFSILVVLGISFAGAAIWRESHTLLFEFYYRIRAGESTRLEFVSIPLGTLLYDGFVLLAWSLFYFAIHDWTELREQRERAAKAEMMAQAARLRALQSQLQPHFLFNTLNAISTLVVEGQTSDAARMIARLSDFLRLTLDTTSTPEISVAEELEFVRRYLEIEQVRFGDRLRVTIHAQPEAMSGLVPALVLQPLVENAVKHGVLTREQGGSVTITVEQKNGALRLSVADDGPGLPANGTAVHGVGLSNTAARLTELYGDASHFSLDPSAAGGLTATIEIPFRSALPRATRGDSAEEPA